MKNKIENTAAAAAADPLLGLAMAMGIVGEEARGQQQVVGSDVLPINLGRDQPALYERLGFVLGEPVLGDPLFRHATLPPGWRREGTDHAMWSTIVDAEGRKRVDVFYKAAFYDRKAHARLVARYDTDMEGETDAWFVRDNKTGETWPADGVDAAYRMAFDLRGGRDIVEQWEAP